jgi:error-prone DNA polymerase
MAREVERELAERVYEQIKGFSGFGFPKSHAAAFGLLAYQSTWLRVHYGPEFLCGLLNEQPMGFYPPDALVHDAQRRGIGVLGPDVSRSAVLCRCEWDPEGRLGVRIGLGYVSGLSERDAEAVVAAREQAPYRDLADLAARSGCSRDGLEKLAWADACASLGLGAEQAREVRGKHGGGDRESQGSSRRHDLWTLGVSRGTVRRGSGEQLPLPLELPGAPRLHEQSAWERVTADYSAFGISLREHPLELLRPELAAETVTSAELRRIRDGAKVVIAGMTVARQRPATANGVVFMLLEDEFGMTNVVVLPPVYERHRLLVRTAGLVSVTGKLERREGVVNVVAERLCELQRPDLRLAEVRPIEPPVERETGRAPEAADSADLADLGAVLPAAHSFGRRGRR